MNNLDFKTVNLLLLISFMAVSFTVYGQSDYGHDRIVGENHISSVSSVLSKMDNITGWALQDNGSWLSSKNRIPLSDENNLAPNNEKEDLGQLNVISLELRRVMIGDEQYMALIHKYRDGEYEFPILQEGWKAYNSYEFYVFRGEKLKEIIPDNFKWNTAWGVNLNVYARGTIKDYTEGERLGEDAIKRAVLMIQKGEVISNYNLVMGVAAVKNGEDESFRFRLIKTFKKDYLVSYYTNLETWEININSRFWEVRSNIFYSFIRDAQEYLVDIEEGLVSIEIDSSYQNLYNWGVIRYQMGDYTGAIEYFQKALKINPGTQDFMLYSFKGNAFSKRKMYNDAIADFDKALSLHPNDILDYSNWVRNYFNRGVAKYYLSNMQGACRDWNKALELGFGQAHDYVIEYCE